MIKKISIFLLFLIYGCGYTSVYKNNNSKDYNIILSEMSGDIVINKLIKNELEIYSNKNSKNSYTIKLETSYSKKVKTRNSSGVATNYEIIIMTNFIKDSKIISFEENFIVKNMSDSVEQRNYEEIIKKNFASSIREKLVARLINVL